MKNENDDIIDVEFVEKESKVIYDDEDAIIINNNTNYNDSKSQTYYKSNVKFIKVNPIIFILLFIAFSIFIFFFLNIIAVIILAVVGISILIKYISKVINKFSK